VRRRATLALVTALRVVALALALVAQGCGGRSAGHGDESGVRAAGGDAGATQPPPGICATVHASGRRHFDGFVFAVDRSAGIASSWALLEGELLALFGSPVSAEMSIGLRFFPDSRPVTGCDSTQCDRDACAALLVPVAPLTDEPVPADQQQARLELAVAENTITKDGPVPGVALSGALAAAADATTDEQSTSVVLVTAGEADSCGVERVQLAADAYQATGTRTFVVAPASVSDFGGLDAIADAGGTEKAIRVGPPDGDRIADALVPIRGAAYTCSISTPDAPEGLSLKFAAALMQVTLDDGAPIFVPLVGGEAACGNERGWYYDDEGAPASIVFCPALCDELTQNRNSELVVSFPCEPPLR
jgi:hypothetical protein